MHNYGLRYQWVETAQAKVRCTYKKCTLSVSGFRCWQLQVPLRGHRDGSGRAWEPVTLQCTPFWSCSAAIPLFLAGTGYKVLFTCCTASLKKLSPGSFFQLDNNGAFMECFQRLEVLYNLIKEIIECINTHTEKQTWWHNNTVIKWWTYMFTQSNMKLTDIYIYMLNHRIVCVCSHMHAGTHVYAHARMRMHTYACTHTESSSVWNWKVYYKIHCSYSWQHLLWVAFRHAYLVHWKTKTKQVRQYKKKRKQQTTSGQEMQQINLQERTPVAEPWKQPRHPSSETVCFFPPRTMESDVIQLILIIVYM